MSYEAWGDEDPADSACSVQGCECDRRAFEATCQGHRDWVECSFCPDMIDFSEALAVYDRDMGAMRVCDRCYGGDR